MTHTKKVLNNGIRLISIPRQESLSVNILVLVEAGSKYETKDVSGISHFLEHMCFKGTAKRPTALSITSELDSIGSEYNAFTSQEFTGYYVTCLPDKLDVALDVISDMYLNPVFDSAEIEKEKGVIREEINLDEDTPRRHISRIFHELIYGDTPAGWSILGTKETVGQISRDHFLDYRGKHYVGESTVVIVAGQFDETAIEDKITVSFSSVEPGKNQGKLPVLEEQSTPVIAVKNKSLDQTHLMLGFRAFGLSDPDVYVAEVLSGILGEGMSSRLFQIIRESKGLCYYITSYLRPFTDHGYLAVAAGVRNESVKEALSAILEECARLKNESVSEQELQRVKDSLIGTTYLGLETPEELGYYYGSQEVLKKDIVSPQEFAAKIKAVTVEDIKRVAERLFTADTLNVAILGPHEMDSSFRSLLRL